MQNPLQLPLQFECAVIGTESVQRLYIEPEIRKKQIMRQRLADLSAPKFLIRSHQETDDCRRFGIRQVKMTFQPGVLPALFGHGTDGIVRIAPAQPPDFIQYARILLPRGRDRSQQIPQAFVVGIQYAVSPRHKAVLLKLISVQCASRNRILLQNMNPGTVSSRIPDQKARCRQTGQSAPDDIEMFLLCPRHRQRPRKSFQISTGIIHADSSIIDPYSCLQRMPVMLIL